MEAAKDIVFRPVKTEDLQKNPDEITRLLYESYRLNFPGKGGLHEFAESRYKDMIRFCKDGSAMLIGAFVDRKIIGFLWAYKRSFLGETRLHISEIAVDSAYRGQGVGTKLLDCIERIAFDEGIQTMELMATKENENVIRFYEKQGFYVTRLQFEKKVKDRGENRLS
jgi:ribosomal protein S18 acetylase RimI-like enzyme